MAVESHVRGDHNHATDSSAAALAVMIRSGKELFQEGFVKNISLVRGVVETRNKVILGQERQIKNL